jgi:hypothetical protein
MVDMEAQEDKKLITGETRDEAINRYREMFRSKDWKNMTLKERVEAINRFRGGYL